MSLYECIKCWEYPCTCGYEYKKRYNNPEEMANYIISILGYRSQEEVNTIIQILNEKINEYDFSEEHVVKRKTKINR